MTAPRARQRGTTLLESLVAFLVLSLGMLSAARVQTQLRFNADVARQRSEAVRLAQEDLESLRAFAVLAATPVARSFDAIGSGTRTVDGAAGYASNTSYLLTRQVDPLPAARAKNASVTVSWTDRNGGPQQVTLNSVIAGSDPAYSGALGLSHAGTTAKGPSARSSAIPVGAKGLGNGTSAYKPVPDGTVAWVFNDATGQIVQRCSGVDAALATRDLTLAALTTCDNQPRRLLSGEIRFTAASPADPAHANDVPLPLSIGLQLSGGSYAGPPECAVEPVKTVSYAGATGPRIASVPLNATPASAGLPAWTETGERHASYRCAVVPLADGRWSGRADLVPGGWSIGAGPSDWRVCRFSPDLDASGSIDANIEHPASYVAVDRNLSNQNFLVVKGSENCPTAAALQIAGNNGDVFADLTTAPHQP